MKPITQLDSKTYIQTPSSFEKKVYKPIATLDAKKLHPYIISGFGDFLSQEEISLLSNRKGEIPTIEVTSEIIDTPTFILSTDTQNSTENEPTSELIQSAGIAELNKIANLAITNQILNSGTNGIEGLNEDSNFFITLRSEKVMFSNNLMKKLKHAYITGELEELQDEIFQDFSQFGINNLQDLVTIIGSSVIKQPEEIESTKYAATDGIGKIIISKDALMWKLRKGAYLGIAATGAITALSNVITNPTLADSLAGVFMSGMYALAGLTGMTFDTLASDKEQYSRILTAITVHYLANDPNTGRIGIGKIVREVSKRD